MAPFVKRQYLYKGHDSMTECRKVLRKSNYTRIDALTGPSLEIHGAGCGVEALLIALVHPEITVTAFEADTEKYLTAVHCTAVPTNLQYINAV